MEFILYKYFPYIVVWERITMAIQGMNREKKSISPTFLLLFSILSTVFILPLKLSFTLSRLYHQKMTNTKKQVFLPGLRKSISCGRQKDLNFLSFRTYSTSTGLKFSIHGRPHLLRASMNGSGSNSSMLYTPGLFQVPFMMSMAPIMAGTPVV